MSHLKVAGKEVVEVKAKIWCLFMVSSLITEPI